MARAAALAIGVLALALEDMAKIPLGCQACPGLKIPRSDTRHSASSKEWAEKRYRTREHLQQRPDRVSRMPGSSPWR